jgi:serine/threonine protein kinase/Tol biopolymer transport system component
MTPEEFSRAGDLFDQLRTAGGEEREAVLAAACPDNSELRREVLRLLDADRKAENSTFLARRAIDDAPGLIPPGAGASCPPALSAGARIGPYRILSQLGRGGMGEVYRAHDTQLHRDVAIKVLAPALANDAQYMERFQYEAKILASLNHPNIATVYGIEQGALVMELVEGENLHGPMPLQEAILIARQIAVALEAAHERGIVHRDLKPANIRITPAGEVKLLDFGLAKSATFPANDPGISPTPVSGISPALTGAGAVFGSAAYMAPERAKGKPADKRADIWAFGAVFYELLTGQRAFGGETSAEILAAVVGDSADLSKLPADTPPYIHRLLDRCLRKDAQTRLRDIGEARIALDEPPEEVPAAPRRKWLFGAVAGLIAIAFALVSFWPRSTARETPSFRLAVAPPEHAGFSLVSLPSLSPDGRYLAFATGSGRQARLWIRDLNATESREIPSTEGAFDPFWSPDSRSIAFFVPGKLKRVVVHQGPVTTICEAADGRGGTWNRDGVIVFAPAYGSPLYRVAAGGGTPERLTELQEADGETGDGFPWFLPDGSHYLYTSRNADPSKNGVFVASLQNGNRSRIVNVSSNAVYSPPGYLLYVRGGTLMAQAFNANRLRTEGDPFTVAQQAGFLPGSLQGQFAVSQTGVLSYYSGSNPLLSQLTWVSREGQILETVGEPEVMQAPALSPDGTTIAVDRLDAATGTYGLWLYNLAKHTVSRLTFGSENDMFPVWSQDGKSILFSSGRGGKLGLYQKEASGGDVEHLLVQMNGITLPTDGSGKEFLVFSNQAPRAENNLFRLALAPGAKPVPFVHSKGSEAHGRVSPDGRWLAYDSDETGSVQVFVATFPQKQGRWQVSGEDGKIEGGTRPVWSHDGRELFYISTSGKLMRVTIDPAATAFTHSRPQPMFETRMPPMSPFAISQDGKRFLILNGIQPDVATPITVVVNWDSGLKK